MTALDSPAKAGWTEGPPLPEPRWHHTAAASKDGYVMVFGGRMYSAPSGRYGHGLVDHALTFFDPHTGTWSVASPMPPYHQRVMNHLASKKTADRAKASGQPDPPVKDSASEAYIYEVPFGGADRQGRAHYFVARGSVFFNPRTGTWGQMETPVVHIYPPSPADNWSEGTMPYWTDRSLGATATGPDGRLYLVGGLGRGPEDKIRAPVIGGLDIYDPQANAWKRGASMKIARQSLAAAFGANGKLYVFGGCACTGEIPLYRAGDEEDQKRAHAETLAQRQSVAETEVYDPKSDTWSSAAPMPAPRMLFAAAAGADGKIYVIGGKASLGGEPVDRVDVYDPATDRWSRGPSLLHARTSHTAVTTGDGTIWVVGGVLGTPGLSEISRLMAGGKDGPTTSVELLKTAPSTGMQ